MAISLQMNPKIENMVTLAGENRCRQKSCKLNTISCRAANVKLAMQNGKTNLYEVLSLSNSKIVGSDEIKKAYRSMALQYHPDVCPPSTKEESTTRFMELRKAYETLSDPISRQMYDYELGLVHSLGCCAGNLRREDKRESFPREVWEKQISGLRKRSGFRMERKKKGHV